MERSERSRVYEVELVEGYERHDLEETLKNYPLELHKDYAALPLCFRLIAPPEMTQEQAHAAINSMRCIVGKGLKGDEPIARLEAEVAPSTFRSVNSRPVDIRRSDLVGAPRSLNGDGLNWSPAFRAGWQVERMVARDPRNPQWTTESNEFYDYRVNAFGNGVDYFLLDSGADEEHFEFSEDEYGTRVQTIYDDFYEVGTDDQNHGTGMVSTGAGRTFGLARNVRIIACKAFDGNNSGNSTAITESFNEFVTFYQTAGNDRPAVMNNSWSTLSSTAFTAAKNACINAGIVLVASAGNTGNDEPNYPAAYTDVLGIMASSIGDNRTIFSTIGSQNDVWTPGRDTLQAWRGNTYAWADGTSPAAGIASGVICSMLQGYGKPTSRTEVEALLTYLTTDGQGCIDNIGRGFHDGPRKMLWLGERDASTMPRIPGWRNRVAPWNNGIRTESINRQVTTYSKAIGPAIETRRTWDERLPKDLIAINTRRFDSEGNIIEGGQGEETPVDPTLQSIVEGGDGEIGALPLIEFPPGFFDEVVIRRRGSRLFVGKIPQTPPSSDQGIPDDPNNPGNPDPDFILTPEEAEAIENDRGDSSPPTDIDVPAVSVGDSPTADAYQVLGLGKWRVNNHGFSAEGATDMRNLGGIDTIDRTDGDGDSMLIPGRGVEENRAYIGSNNNVDSRMYRPFPVRMTDDSNPVHMVDFFTNLDFTDSTLGGWVTTGPGTPELKTVSGSLFPYDGILMYEGTGGADSSIIQTQDLPALVSLAQVDAGNMYLYFEAWFGVTSGNSTDAARVRVEALDGSNVLLGTPYDSGAIDGQTGTANTWDRGAFRDEQLLPSGTRRLRVTVESIFGAGTVVNVAVDGLYGILYERTDRGERNVIQIDEGNSGFEFAALTRSFNIDSDDAGRMELTMYGLGQQDLLANYVSPYYSPYKWTDVYFRRSVPPGTRVVRVAVRFLRRAGTVINSYWRDMRFNFIAGAIDRRRGSTHRNYTTGFAPTVLPSEVSDNNSWLLEPGAASVNVIQVSQAPGVPEIASVGDGEVTIGDFLLLPDVPVEGNRTAIISLTGQSNMIGRHGPQISPEDDTDPNILQWDGAAFILAAQPLEHVDPQAGDAGPGLSLAKTWLANNSDSYDRVILVPNAEGGTGHFSYDWNRPDALYLDAVSNINSAYALAESTYGVGTVDLIAFVHHQGEADLDGGDGAEAATNSMRQHRVNLVDALRRDVTAATETTPFVSGGLPTDWTVPTDLPGVNTAFSNVGLTMPSYGYANPIGLASEAGDDIHFSAPSQRTMGERYAAAIDAAIAAGGSAPTFPSVPTDQGNVIFYMSADGQADFTPIRELENDTPFDHRRCYIQNNNFQFANNTDLDNEVLIRFKRSDTPDLTTQDWRIRVVFTPDSSAGNTLNAGGLQGIIGVWDSTNAQRSWLLAKEAGNDMRFYWATTGSVTAGFINAEAALNNGVENVVEVIRQGNQIEIYVNDLVTPAGSGTAAATFHTTATTNDQYGLVIGGYGVSYGTAGAEREFGGSIKEIVIDAPYIAPP